MAYYDALILAWNSAIQPPVGVTGTALTAGMTTRQKVNAVNSWTIGGAPNRAIVSATDIMNAIRFSDLDALTQKQLSELNLLLLGNSVDVSQGTNIRDGIQSLFAGKTQTISNLAALVAPFDTPIVSWAQANGYPYSGVKGNLNTNDASAAGLS